MEKGRHILLFVFHTPHLRGKKRSLWGTHISDIQTLSSPKYSFPLAFSRSYYRVIYLTHCLRVTKFNSNYFLENKPLGQIVALHLQGWGFDFHFCPELPCSPCTSRFFLQNPKICLVGWLASLKSVCVCVIIQAPCDLQKMENWMILEDLGGCTVFLNCPNLATQMTVLSAVSSPAQGSFSPQNTKHFSPDQTVTKNWPHIHANCNAN